jgi:hypothetical protein
VRACVRVCASVCAWVRVGPCGCVCACVSRGLSFCACASLSVCARLRASVCVLQHLWWCLCGFRECVGACVWRAFACVRGSLCGLGSRLPSSVCLSALVCVRHDCVCAPQRLCGRFGGTAGTGGINCSAGGGGRPRACAVAVRCDWPVVARVRAAGVTWTSRTTSAPWAARSYHTSVVDAAGAIYVIGGYGGGTYYKDVYVSTDGGAQAGLGQGSGRRVHQGRTWGYFGGTLGYDMGY